MNHLNDRRRCPHCRRDMNERPYIMSRRATENVIPSVTIAWIVVLAMLLLAVFR